MNLSEEQLRLLIQSSPEPTVIYLIKDATSPLIPFLYSEDVPSFSGLSEQEYLDLYKNDAKEVVVSEDLEALQKALRQIIVSRKSDTCTYRTYHKTRGPIWTHAAFKWIGEYNGSQVLLGIFTDISNQVAENTPGGFFIYAAEENDQFFFINKNMLRMLGYTLAEFQIKFHNRFRNMIYAEDRETTLQSIEEQIKQNGQFDSVDYRIEKKDGELIWVHDEGHYIVDSAGRPWFYVTIYDMSKAVTERDLLKKANTELGVIINCLPVGISVFKIKDRKIQEVNSNETFRLMLCVTDDQLKESEDNTVAKNVHPDDYASIQKDMLIMQKPGRHVTVPFRYGNNGHDWRWLRIEAVTKEMPDHTLCIYSAIIDQTAEKSAESQLDKAHQTKLAQYETSLHSLLFANPQSLCTVRMNLTRNKCEQWYGTSPYVISTIRSDTAEGVIDNILKIILNQEDQERFKEHFNRSALLIAYSHGIRNDSLRYRRRAEDGTYLWVKTVVNMVENPESNDIEAVLFSEDVSDQVLDEEIIRKSTDSGFDYIARLNVPQKTYQNCYIDNLMPDKYKTFQQMFQQPRSYEEFVEYAKNNWYEGEQKEHFLKVAPIEHIIAHLQEENTYTITIRSKFHEEAEAWKQIRFIWLDDSHDWILVTQTDITESVNAEQEKLMERLNTERILRNEADKANESKSNFISNVSHDMRTPLNAILGYDHLALETESPEIRSSYLKKIGEAGETLLSLINDTLDLQKIETGKITLHPEPVPCSAVVNGVLTAVKPMMDAKKIHFTFDNSKAVWATINIDEMRVEEILINLLSNAAKFTSEGGDVLMAVECEKETDTDIYDKIIIKDTGAGISESFLPRIYEPFAQERTEKTAGIGGSGLGLSIVKRLVDLMNGRIDVHSKLGEGTEFDVYLTLPKATDTVEADGKAKDVDLKFLRGRKVLLCEDNEMNREIATAILEKNGVVVLSAVNGKIGAEMFQKSKPGEISAVLMDIRMPVMDGYEASRQIRKSDHPDAKRVPIIALSADAYQADIKKAEESGMNNHVSKPINAQVLLLMLNNEIQKAS